MPDVRARVAVLASGSVVLLAVLGLLLASPLRRVVLSTASVPLATERLRTVDPLLDPGRFAKAAAAGAPRPLDELRRALRSGGFDDGRRGGIPRLFVVARATVSERGDRSRERRGGGRDRSASGRGGAAISVEEAADDDRGDRSPYTRRNRGDDDRGDRGGGAGDFASDGGGSEVSNGGDEAGSGDGWDGSANGGSGGTGGDARGWNGGTGDDAGGSDADD